MTEPDSGEPAKIICPCSGITLEYIEKLIADGNDMDAIADRTGACTGCGGCEAAVFELLENAA